MAPLRTLPVVDTNVAAFVQISSNLTAHPGADERTWTGCSGRPPVHCQTVCPDPAAMAGVQRGISRYSDS
jgi:hypothetical protein